MLTEKEAFKVGFLKRCADAGLDANETLQAIKQAMTMLKEADVTELLMGPYRTGLDVVGTGAKNLTNLGAGAAIAAPFVLGGGAGLLASKLTDVDDTDVNAIKKRELIDEYHRQIQLLQSKRRGVYKHPKAGPV